MHSIVPFIGGDALEKNQSLKARIQHIIEEIFGHELRFVDEGSVFVLHRADPLKILVPFTVSIEGVASPRMGNDILHPIQKLFPSAPHIETPLDQLPSVLMSRGQELSLGHFTSDSSLIRKEVWYVYQNLSRHGYNLSMIAHDIGISRSALERECARIGGEHGAAHIMKRIKMTEASRMVIETEADINEIAYAVGFENLASFDRAFIRAWGTSPSYLRRNAKSLGRNANVLS